MPDRSPVFEHTQEEFGDLLAALDDAEQAGAMLLLTGAIGILTAAVLTGSALAQGMF